MRLIRLFFWLVATVIVAYFLTDIHLAGKTLKQHIDDFIRSDAGVDIKTKASNVLTNLEKLTHQPSDLKKADPAKTGDKKPAEPVKSPPTKDELTREDERELKKIIKTNQ